MSAASCLLTEDQLLCGICLDVFVDPITLPCGHNFCKACIARHWDGNTVCQCPTCKEPFFKRLDLRVNTFVSEMAVQFRQLNRKRNSRIVRPGDVACSVCVEPKMRALKSCLVCLASYCETHLKPHLMVLRLKKHELIEPLQNLEKRMCPVHEKPLELFCKTDQTCICMQCPVSDHREHKVTLLKEQFERKKAELCRREVEIRQMIRERRKKIWDMKHNVKLSKDAADREKADGIHVLTALMESLERAKTELVEMIEKKQKISEKKAKIFIKELEQEIHELTKRQAEMEQLSRTKDHLHFLQSLDSLSPLVLHRTKDWTEVNMNLQSFEGTVKKAVDLLGEVLGQQMKKVLGEAQLSRVQQFEVDVTLDPDTAHPSLVLSDDGKQVHHSLGRENLEDNPKRFNPSCCVLAKQCFSSGKFYFETQVLGKTRWALGVAKESIKRKGILSLCPENGHWTMWLKNGEEYAALVGSPLPLTLKSKLLKVGVFVDYDEGRVSFYDVDTADLLYSFTGCSFTGKLYPFFSPGLSDEGRNSTPMIISSITKR